jgi:hypothetical protein
MKPLRSLSLTAALALLALGFTPWEATAAPPQISFTVHHLNEENVEGPNVERTYFMAGGKRLIFGQPKGKMIIDANGLDIQLKDEGLNGEIQINRSPLTPEVDLVQNALQYREAATLGLPKGATRVELLQPVMDPYPFNGWKSLGFVWNYAFFGQPMKRTVNYVNLNVGVQLVVTTLASKEDTEKVERIAQQFLASWWVKGG